MQLDTAFGLSAHPSAQSPYSSDESDVDTGGLTRDWDLEDAKSVGSDGGVDNIVSGDTSDIENSRDQLRSEEEIEIARASIRNGLYLEKFAVCFSCQKAVITVSLKESAKNAMRHEYRKAQMVIVKTGKCRTLPVSCSFTLGAYSVEEIIDKSRSWSLWLSAWIYGESPVVSLPVGTPLPPKFEVGPPKLPPRPVVATTRKTRPI